MSSKTLIASAALLLLGACNTIQESGSVDPSFGEAFKYDMAIQTIDPDPVYDDTGAQPGDNGDVGAQAVKRYRSGAAVDVEVMSTSSTQSSGSGPN